MRGQLKAETLKKLVKDGLAYHCTSCGHVQPSRKKRADTWKGWKNLRCAKCHKRGTLETAMLEDLK